jgi:ABC-type antimicrobial peptide transport system permease subunit
MVRKISFWAIWLGFISYAFIFAPEDSPNTFELIKNLSTGQWEGINPLVIALFNIMGVLPMIYSCILFIDGRGQKIPAWLFATVSFAVGAFAIVPYLALRAENKQFFGKKNLFIKILDSRITGVFLTLGAAILVVYGFRGGDWANFVQQWQTSRFIHVMSLDFCLLCLLLPTLLGDDMARRQVKNPQVLSLIALVPLFGPLIYLCVRPPLTETVVGVNQNQVVLN